MPCPHRRNALRVLMGELGHGASSRMLAHFRVCGECREAFDFGASTIAGRTAASARPKGGAAPAAGAGDAPSSGLIRLRGDPAGLRRNRRMILVVAVAVLAFGIAGLGGRRQEAPPPFDPPPEVVWRGLVRGGTPVVQSPAGTFEGRPRAIVALVPPGAGSFGVTVLDVAGKPVFRSDATPGERGCVVEETEIPAPGGAFRAVRLVVPFPDEASLAIDAGAAYGVVVSVSGGHASSSAVFHVAEGPEPLHGARAESR